MSEQWMDPNKKKNNGRLIARIATLCAVVVAVVVIVVGTNSTAKTEITQEETVYLHTEKTPAQTEEPVEEETEKAATADDLDPINEEDLYVKQPKQPVVATGKDSMRVIEEEPSVQVHENVGDPPMQGAYPQSSYYYDNYQLTDPSATVDPSQNEKDATQAEKDEDSEKQSEEEDASKEGSTEEEELSEQEAEEAETSTATDENEAENSSDTDDSIHMDDTFEGEEMTEGIESLMYKPIETRIGLLQERLMELGYMEEDPVPQIFDPQTQLAIMYFQREHDRTITGIADTETYDLALSDEAKEYRIARGTEGEDVRQLQTNLESLGHQVSPTGVYDTETDAAVTSFRHTHNLNIADTIDMETRRAVAIEAALHGSQVQANYQTGSYPNSASIEELIRVAEAQMGKLYVWGAKGPNSFDCSGLVYYSLNQSGYSIEYMTSSGWAKAPYTTVSSIGELQRGDIVCFKGHVGIYIGNDRMIDASSSQGKVRVSSELSTSGYWTQSFICGKRIF